MSSESIAGNFTIDSQQLGLSRHPFSGIFQPYLGISGPSLRVSLGTASPSLLNLLSRFLGHLKVTGVVEGTLSTGQNLMATLSAIVTLNFCPESGHEAVFLLSSVTLSEQVSNKLNQMEPCWEFELCNVRISLYDEISQYVRDGKTYLTARDKIYFLAFERKWELVKGNATRSPNKGAFHSAGFLTNVFLRTQKLPSDTAPPVKEMADAICSLLTLALGRHIRWLTLKHISTTGEKKIAYSFGPFQAFSDYAPVLINNWKTGNLAAFISKCSSHLRTNSTWWKDTIGWLHEARTQVYLEHRLALLFVILDRCSSANREEVKCNLADNLEEKIAAGNKGGSFRAEIEDLMSRYDVSKWTRERTNALIGKLKEWNSTESFPNKVRYLCESLLLPPPGKKLLGLRHKLLHIGEHDLEAGECRDKWLELDWVVTSIVLRMLAYEGEMFHPFFPQETFLLASKLLPVSPSKQSVAC